MRSNSLLVRICTFLLAFATVTTGMQPAVAQKITALPAVTSLTGPEIIPLIQGGVGKSATVGQILASTSVFAYLTPAQIADVKARTCATDVGANVNTAIAAGVPLLFPAGLYCTSVQLNLRSTDLNVLRGDGEMTEIRATAPMAYLLNREGTDNGGQKLPSTFVSNMTLNGNRNANVLLRIAAGKKGVVTHVRGKDFLVGGMRFGDDSGNTTTQLYETDITDINLDGNITYAGAKSTMPKYGMWFTNNATDNFVDRITGMYIADVGVASFGGFNNLSHIHVYGQNSTGTGPDYSIIAGAASNISSPEIDNPAVAGIKVASDSVSIAGGSTYFTAGNMPGGAAFAGSVTDNTLSAGVPTSGPIAIGQTVTAANAMVPARIVAQVSGTTGGAGTYTLDGAAQTVSTGSMQSTGPVTVEVASGVSSLIFTGHTIRNGNPINPAVRWLGSARPGQMVVNVQGSITPQINDPGAASTLNTLLMARRTGYDTQLTQDGATGQAVRNEMRIGNAPKYRSGIDSSGAFSLDYRSGSTWAQSIRGGTAGELGFYGAAPVAKPTVAAALATDGTATNAAIAAAINSQRSALIAMGLAQ